MNESQNKLLELLKTEDKVFAMLAPAFPLDFSYPEIIGGLKKLGFDKVTELTFGARMVNYWYAEYIKKNPDEKYYITSPCPTCVTLIKNKYPEIAKYLVPYVSPMAAMARIIKDKFPNYKVVFFSPCIAKRNLEWPKYKDIIDLVVTFKELDQIFENQNIKSEDFKDQDYKFDSLITECTKIYPISGGLAETSQIQKFFKPEEIYIGDEPKNLMPIFEEIKNSTSKYKFFDILNCPGGCIGGPEIMNKKISIEEKQKIIKAYRDLGEKEKAKMGNCTSDVSSVENIGFSTTI